MLFSEVAPSLSGVHPGKFWPGNLTSFIKSVLHIGLYKEVFNVLSNIIKVTLGVVSDIQEIN